MTGKDALSMWTIYDHPKDYPGCYVARQWRVNAAGPVPTENIIACPDLDALRGQMVDMGLTCLSRNAEDDAAIVETWV